MSTIKSVTILLIVIAVAFIFKQLIIPYDGISVRSYSEVPPLQVFIFLNILSSGLRYIADQLTPPPVRLIDDYLGAFKSQVLYVVSKLDLPDHLANGPKTIEELTFLTNVAKSDNILRLLRAAEGFGYFRENVENHMWSNTVLSSVLRTDHPNSMAKVIRHWKEDSYDSWGSLFRSITEENAIVFEDLHNGTTLWKHYEKNPEIEVQFAGAMTGLNSINLYGQVHDYGWSQYSRIIDIGGSMGTFLFGILEANPSLQGVLFDRPIVIEKAVEYWNSKASSTLHNTMVTSGAVEFLGGSFFDAATLPTFKHNDVIVMRMILHDWIDEDCLRILRAIREAILRSGSPEVTLVLSELTPEVHDVIPTKFLIDLHMQVLFGAKERRDSKQCLVLFELDHYTA
eukprot:gene22877-29631_t